ncbi:LysR family transcriptional regulator [Chimaeribacter arupi]|uniref:LysR family transcriptional regulator n=1 Tax=Chimaeribacter arupi TaxID=2060066 RepID=UPI000C798B1B|nr:LysR family transcriptional regulator [Chimaeribacter arupi]PLR44082.1 LysR family transcriptional regulator [Chimaeribacter arupi]PLR48493.1 LysR family transcriptional regulator [Chimaeribacter arupi]
METLANIESFMRSAEGGSFSAAARRLGLTPAAVSRNVAMLERNLGQRLFLRSTRKLTLTEAGERFRQAVGSHLEGLQAAIAAQTTQQGEPAGVLKISMSLVFGTDYLLPLLPAFIARYPAVRPECHFENRASDLIAEGIDVAIGGGFALTPGLVARSLAPAHCIAVAAPAVLAGRSLPATPDDLAAFDGILLRSANTGRLRRWVLRNAAGEEQAAMLRESLVVNDPLAMRQAALQGLGVALITLPDALPWLASGALVRLLPDWYADLGPISVYYANRTLLPAKTRVFVDYLVEAFRERDYATHFNARLPQAR